MGPLQMSIRIALIALIRISTNSVKSFIRHGSVRSVQLFCEVV